MARAKKRDGKEVAPGTLDPQGLRRAASAALGALEAEKTTDEEERGTGGFGTGQREVPLRRGATGGSPLPSSAVGQGVPHHPGIDSRKR